MASEKAREQNLARAFCTGAETFGIQTVIRSTQDAVNDVDLACMVGVKSRELAQRCAMTGTRFLFFDKGYIRRRGDDPNSWEYWRVALDANQPTAHLMDRCYSGDRWARLGLEVKPWRQRGRHIVIAGSSLKYHEFAGLPHPTEWAKHVVAQLRHLTARKVYYRPKPSWRDAERIRHVRFSGPSQSLAEILTDCHCLVTHGSNACFEAALAGVPSIVLGDAVARPIASTGIDEVERPWLADRTQWLHNLAYHQFTEREMASGLAWHTIRGWL